MVHQESAGKVLLVSVSSLTRSPHLALRSGKCGPERFSDHHAVTSMVKKQILALQIIHHDTEYEQHPGSNFVRILSLVFRKCAGQGK